MLKMYGFWRSQATFRVRVALNLKGIAYEETPINLDKGEARSDEFRKINPMGSLPALMIGDEPLTQSLAILEYIEETHPTPALLPKDPLARARVRGLAAIAVSDTHPLIVPRVRGYLSEKAGFDADKWKAWQTHFFSAGLRGYEARLAGSPATGTYCHGDSVSFADICLAGLFAGTKQFGIALEPLPTVERIFAHCMRQDAFEKARAIHQSDYPG